MPRKSPGSLNSAEVDACVSESRALEQVRASKPPVEEYVSEGVIDHMPEEDADGRIDVRIEGHDNVVRALKMNEEFRRKEAEHFDARRESPLKRDYREAKAEQSARKHHRPRATIVVPEMPWKREKGGG